MNPFLLTVTFLALLAILTTAQVKHFAHQVIGNAFFKSAFENSLFVEKNREIAAFEGFKKTVSSSQEVDPYPDTVDDEEDDDIKVAPKKPTASRALGIDFARPPDNSRLNVYLLLEGKKGFLSHYEIAATLLRNLYGDHPLFQGHPGVEYALLDALMDKKEKAVDFTTPDDLAQIVLEDKSLQTLFFALLTGNLQSDTRSYPSLLYYLSFDKEAKGFNKKINLLFASPELLGAIFQDSGVREKFLSYRASLYDRIIYEEENRKKLDKDQCLNRTKIHKNLESAFEETFANSGLDVKTYKALFDFHVGFPGSFLLFLDPTTKVMIREKVQ